MSMIGDPFIIILDEPTSGLDPYSRINILKIIKKLQSKGKCIIITTHFMEEAEYLADKIIVIIYKLKELILFILLFF